ncbi:DUF7331 family protein [Natronobiforma cellulositropha]|nr:hypothetical protein [Natronobiforma cellulositropha]
MRDVSARRGRYVQDETADGSVRIYDTENEQAWIESDMALSIAWLV